MMEYFLFETYWGSIIFMLIGILQLLHTLRHTKRRMNSSLQPYSSGIVSGLGFIIAGLAIFIIITYNKI